MDFGVIYDETVKEWIVHSTTFGVYLNLVWTSNGFGSIHSRAWSISDVDKNAEAPEPGLLCFLTSARKAWPMLNQPQTEWNGEPQPETKSLAQRLISCYIVPFRFPIRGWDLTSTTPIKIFLVRKGKYPCATSVRIPSCIACIARCHGSRDEYDVFHCHSPSVKESQYFSACGDRRPASQRRSRTLHGNKNMTA